MIWSGHKVPITHINHCHLVIYEQQLQSILLSHCHYSLTAGSSHLVRYDLQALEKHILDRFIHGKPMILADIPQVVYRKDTYTATRFGAIRKKVSPQVSSLNGGRENAISRNIIDTCKHHFYGNAEYYIYLSSVVPYSLFNPL